MKTIALALVACLTVLSVPPSGCPESVSPEPAPGRLRVEVLSQLGRPIPSARVRLRRRPGPEEKDAAVGEAVLESVSPGVFAGEVAPGRYRVWAGGEEWVGASEEGVEVQSGLTRELEFRLEPGLVISGRVEDEAGDPLSGATVSYRPSGSPRSLPPDPFFRDTVTDPAGRFAFRHLPAGVYDLEFKRPGYLDSRIKTVTTGTEDLATVLKRGFSIRGRLEGELEGLESPVRLQVRGGPGRRPGRSTRRVEPGPGHDFEIDGLERGTYSVRVRDGNHYSEWVPGSEALPPGEARPITLTVVRGASLAGRVRSAEDGSPLPGVVLELIPAGRRSGDWVFSSDEGEYAFQTLEAGEYTLRVRLPGDPRDEFRLERKVRVEPGRDLAGIDLEVETGRQTILSGTVLDEKGNPVEGAKIMLRFYPRGEEDRHLLPWPLTVTDQSGEFSHPLFLESPGEVEIFTYLPGHSRVETRFEVSPDQPAVSGITLVLESGVTLEVEVGGGEDGRQPVPGAVVSLSTDWLSGRMIPGFRDRKQLTDSRGRCRLEKLPAGTYRIEVSKPGYSTTVDKFSLEGDQPIETLNLVLEPGRNLLVRVENPRGEALPAAAVHAGEHSPEFDYEYMFRDEAELPRTDSSGACLLRDLPAAPLSLSVTAEGYVPLQRYRVDRDRDEVRVVLKDAGSIRGRILDTDGAPPDDFTVIPQNRAVGFFDLLAVFSEPRLPGGGVFEILNLAPGAYDLTVQSPNLAGTVLEAVEVEAGRKTELGDIVLGPASAISGLVRDRADGSPLPGVMVRIETPGAGLISLIGSSDLTGPGGDFTIDGLGSGTFTLSAMKQDFVLERVTGVTVGSGEEKKIPDILLSRLSELEKERRAQRSPVIPSLGVRIGDPDQPEETELPDSLPIDEVLPGTAAAAAGLAAGDEILRINDHGISEDPLGFIQGLMAPPGTEIKLTVRRAGTGREEEVELTTDSWSLEDILQETFGPE